MKRTGTRDIIIATIVGISVGYLLQSLLVSLGARMLVPPITFPVTLTLAAAIVLTVAWPVRAALRGTRKRPVNALYAARVAMLAKASSISGALLFGFAGGLTYFVLTRSVVPGAGTIGLLVASVIAGAVLLAAGLIAERFCTLPPENPDEDSAPEPAVSHG